jgi:ligand-binding SRPBCC domain-containing protein
MPRIESRIELAVPVETVFRWYSDVNNVPRMTPPGLHLRLVKAELPLREGSRVKFTIRPRLVPFEIDWLLQVTEFEPNRRFSERLRNGPFDVWVHSHEFIDLGDGRSRVIDAIEWDRPAFIIRAVASDQFIREKLDETFAYRERVLRRELESSVTGLSLGTSMGGSTN